MKKLLLTLIALVTLQPLAAMEGRANQNNKQAEQKMLNDALISAVSADSNFNDNEDTIYSLLCQGADINHEDKFGRTALFYAKRRQTCSLLLLNGAHILPKKDENDGVIRNPIHFSASGEQETTLLCEGVYGPAESVMQNSKKIIMTMLCILNRYRVPRDIRTIILTQDSQRHLGNAMIARKLRGLPVPLPFIPATKNALYDSTIRQLKLIINDHPFLSNKINKETFEAYAQVVRINIEYRLKQERLFSNGVAQPESSCTIL